MQHDGGGPPDQDPGGGDQATRWQSVVSAHGPADAAPTVRLRREFKGLTVRDLVADAGLDDQLPGVVRSALAHIERGNLAAAESVLPGHFAPVLDGPGRDYRHARRRFVRWIAIAALAAAAATATIKLL